MSTLLQGQTASLVLSVGDSYTISSAGTVTVRGIYGAPSTTTTITASFATFGPYAAPAKLDVVAVSGPAEYAIVAPTQTPVSGGGHVTSGVWVTPPSIFRLRLTGTGTATVDARDKLGAITLGVATYTASGATNQIEYPYLGDAASDMRVTLTGTTTAEVM